ncbi:MULTISPECIES: preprotein translocase subunit SecE [unclassified Nocardioides]|uniref:preprotein translocase subunit SecE n=1 Tax=unclassified Nocardioides TaxID=2615069 RepID=UPI000AA984A7|nr:MULTISPECIES: preprotein translocase subunit SecE [unclassified Nocardioides]
MSILSDAPAVHGGRKDASGGKKSPKRTGPVTFYRQIVAELRKVVYPTREQLVTYFFVVLVFVLVMIALVSLLDLGLGKLAFEVFTGADDI